MTKMNLAQVQASHPLDLSALDNVTDPNEYDRLMNEAVQNQLKQGGLISPTTNTTNFQTEASGGTEGFTKNVSQQIARNTPNVFDRPDSSDSYMEERFKRITSHEGWKDTVYKDALGIKHIGYGFNIEEPTNRDVFKRALKTDDKHLDAIKDGTKKLSLREGRILFEASVGNAEKLITQKFGDLPLKGYQRMALVSMAYNHPALIGPNLTKYVRAGDFKSAKDEILNRSNKYNLKGIANRRIDEANLFSGMHTDEDESGFNLASMFGVSPAMAGTLPNTDAVSGGLGSDSMAPNAPRPKMKPITNFGNLPTTVKSSDLDTEESDSVFDMAKQIASDVADSLKSLVTFDYDMMPTPVMMLARAVTQSADDLKKVTYRRSDFDYAAQEMVQQIYQTAKKAGRGFTVYEDYPALANGLSVKALLGDATKFNPKTGDYYRGKNGKPIFYPKLREELRKEREKFYPAGPAGLIRMAWDMQHDPVFRVAGAIGRFSIQKSKDGEYIKERWNFNTRNKAGEEDGFGRARQFFGNKGAPIKEDEGPLVLFPLSGSITEADIEKMGKA